MRRKPRKVDIPTDASPAFREQLTKLNVCGDAPRSLIQALNELARTLNRSPEALWAYALDVDDTVARAVRHPDTLLSIFNTPPELTPAERDVVQLKLKAYYLCRAHVRGSALFISTSLLLKPEDPAALCFRCPEVLTCFAATERTDPRACALEGPHSRLPVTIKNLQTSRAEVYSARLDVAVWVGLSSITEGKS